MFFSYPLEFHLSLGVGGHHFVVTPVDIGVGPVHQVQVHVLQSKVLQGLTAGVLHPLGFMEVAPQLKWVSIQGLVFDV